MLSLCNPNFTTHILVKDKVLSLKKMQIIQKRVSFSSSFLLRGSMAVEAALVLPLFLFYIMTLLYSLEMVRFQSDVVEALHKVGRSAGILMQEGFRDDVSDSVHYELSQNQLPYLCVEGEENGVKVRTDYHVLGEGNLQITADYRIKPFIFWLPVGDIQVEEHCFLHGFTGYKKGKGVEENKPEQYVYITPSGEKYHLSENCTYLRVQLQVVSTEKIESLRNADGEIYRPCETCKPKGNGVCYYTRWGNRYHDTSDCTALKRTVYLVPLSQAEGRTACSKCG